MTEARPVILLGAARSGTKFLRDLLATPARFRRVPYDANYVWRFGNSSAASDILDGASLSSSNQKAISESLWKIACAGGLPRGPDDVLVEKTVSSSLRPDFARAVFPNARFVVLIRDGRDVVESTYRMWQAPPDRGALMQKLATLPLRALPYAAWFGSNLIAGRMMGRGAGVWGVRYPNIDADLAQYGLEYVCAQQWRQCVSASMDFVARMCSDTVMCVRYEDLVRDESQIETLAAFVGMNADEAATVVSAWQDTRRQGNSRWSTGFDSEQRAVVQGVISEVMADLGYSFDSPLAAAPASQET